jgi:UDP-N-acetyl-D-glucosamine dehydrogenase
MEIIGKRGGTADYHDPFVREIPATREYMDLKGRKSVKLTREIVESYDAVLVSTDHDDVDYAALAAWSPLIVDTRNVFTRRGLMADHIVKS